MQMRIELSGWRKANFMEKLRGNLLTLVKAVNKQNPSIGSLCLVKSADPEDDLEPITILNALLGRLGRVHSLDQELGLRRECFSDIKMLTLSGFTFSDFKQFIPFFSRHYYPFLEELVFE